MAKAKAKEEKETPEGIVAYAGDRALPVEGKLERQLLMGVIADKYGLDTEIEVDLANAPKRTRYNAQFHQREDGTAFFRIVDLEALEQERAEAAQRLGGLPSPTGAVTTATTVTPIEGRFRMAEGSEIWHFCKNCSNYPADADVARSRMTKPDDGLCSECVSKQERGECERA